MRGIVPVEKTEAISTAVQTGSEKSSTVQTDTEDHRWFTIPARHLLGSDPGLALHVLIGVSESSGYRYAKGERGISGLNMRQLLHSRHGEPWLAAIMDGCTEPWWIELQAARDLTSKFKITKR